MIDLRSDTVTQPTQAMREAMFQAEVGDDVYMDDPTMLRLEALGAQILGKEACMFVPSGTMGNQVALMTHTRRGDEVILDVDAHIYVHEVGAPALLSGVSQRLVPMQGPGAAENVERAIQGEDLHEAPTSLVCMENALSNGRVIPLDVMRDIHAVAKQHNLAVHLDGARLFNAAVALGADVQELTQYTDSVSCCLSKGLCAPVGSLLAGDAAFIRRARKNRKILGGGMRQAGILAAAGILALTEMPKRLHEDHANAKRLAELLSQIEGISVDMASVQINIVWFRVDAPASVLDSMQQRMLERGIKINGNMNGLFRFVTNNDVSRADAEAAASAFGELLRT